MNTTDPDLVSIIVPVYKVEEDLLQHCVDSIENQTYKNLEVIIVDDGAEKPLASFCDQLAQRYSNITVIHQENGGVSVARNTGMAKARGEYINFIDSDDWVDDQFIEKMVTFANQHNLDIVVSGYNITDDKGVRYPYQYPSAMQMSNIEAMEEMFRQRAFTWVPVDKLFRRELVLENQLSFPKGISMGEDLAFCWQAFLKSNRIGFIPYYGYHYYMRSDSATHAPDPERKMPVLKVLKDILASEIPSAALRNQVEILYLKEMASCCVTMILYGDHTYREQVARYQSHIRRNGHKLLFSKEYSWKVKLGTIFLYLPYSICIQCRRFL